MSSSTARETNAKPTAAHRLRTLLRRSGKTLLIIFLILVALRIALPFAIKAYVNHQLERTPNYSGSIGDVDVHLWRGAYQIQDVKIMKTEGEVPAPLFAARKMDLSLEWRALLHGALVGEIVLEAPEVHIVAGPTDEQSQTGKENDWKKTVESLFPLKINRFQINQGRVHFQNFDSEPPVNIYVTDLFATATNLSNAREVHEPLPAGLIAEGHSLGEGRLDVELHMNPLASSPTFEITAQVTNVNLVELNDFLKAYGKFDVARGQFALYASFAAADQKYDGYAKVFFEDLDVFAWEKERKKNVLQIFWQAIVGGVTTVFRNQPNDRLATKIPFSGSYSNNSVGVFPAIGTLLRNAFISALVPKLDQTIKVEEVKLDEKAPAEPVSSPRSTKSDK